MLFSVVSVVTRGCHGYTIPLSGYVELCYPIWLPLMATNGQQTNRSASRTVNTIKYTLCCVIEHTVVCQKPIMNEIYHHCYFNNYDLCKMVIITSTLHYRMMSLYDYVTTRLTAMILTLPAEMFHQIVRHLLYIAHYHIRSLCIMKCCNMVYI